MCCKPWYYRQHLGKNVSNNTDLTVTPKDGKMVQTEDCFEIAALADQPARRDPAEGAGARSGHLIPDHIPTNQEQEPASLDAEH